MAGVTDIVGQSIVQAFGTSGVKPLGTVTTGPAFTPTGAPIPFFNVSREPGPFGGSSTRFTPTGFFETRTVEQAAKSFFQEAPGKEVTSFAPGAADLWRQLASGFLPTLRPEGQARAVGDSGGFAEGMIGQTSRGLGAGLPPLVWAGIAAGVVVLLFYMTRRR